MGQSLSCEANSHQANQETSRLSSNIISVIKSKMMRLAGDEKCIQNFGPKTRREEATLKT
jgi:hypothetical protein